MVIAPSNVRSIQGNRAYTRHFCNADLRVHHVGQVERMQKSGMYVCTWWNVSTTSLETLILVMAIYSSPISPITITTSKSCGIITNQTNILGYKNLGNVHLKSSSFFKKWVEKILFMLKLAKNRQIQEDSSSTVPGSDENMELFWNLYNKFDNP